MPRYIVKPVRDDDFYVEWSTIVDAPVDYGSREQMIAWDISPERLDRADRLGTSSLWSYRGKGGVARRPFDYSQEEFMISEGFDHELTPDDHVSYIRREALKEFLTTDHGKAVYWDHNHPAIRWEPADD